jgi:hypothetical protein
MRLITLIIFLSFQIQIADAQTQLNQSLKQELDSILILDQKYRALLVLSSNGKEDSLAAVFDVKKDELNNYLWKLQNEIDSSNIVRTEEIIKQYGYPGSSLVDTPANETAFYVIQHSKVIDKYLPIIKIAAEKKELSFRLYAMMLDRSLMFQDKEQIYGTQGTGISVKNASTGKWETLLFMWPIHDPLTVNERRKAAGFTQTIEDYSKNLLGIEYRVLSLEEALKMREEVMKSNK